MTQVEPKKYPNCFGCGESNPIGLRLKYRREGDRLRTEFMPGDVHQGWPGIVHGGIIATLLYEVMENFPYYQGIKAMMRGMETRFRRPANTGEIIVATSWLSETEGREISVLGALNGQDGRVIAEGKAGLMALREDQIERLGIQG